MATVPRAAVVAVMNTMQAIAVLHPDLATPAVEQAFAMLGACVADNPVNGMLRRQGADQCPAVTEALAAQAKELADAKKAAAQPPKPTDPAKP